MITRRQTLGILGMAAAFPWVTFAESKPASKKKGWCGDDDSLHELFRASWYYSWQPTTSSSSTMEFVPMIKSEHNIESIPRIGEATEGSALLGFNEPEQETQGNVTLERALELWPQLVAFAEKRNLRLGSPAPSSNGKGMKWFEAFMDEANRRKLRVDFIAMHWYRSRSAADFEGFIKDLTRKYRRPIWITEFNGWSGPEKENYDFLKGTLRFMERASSNVERYAYFNPHPGEPHSLLNLDGSLTRMGELYRDT